ncbi:MAG: fibronectin type III domain-containing protein [bacterium]|nr:fibronectin type III domain-containing protein [bacterium]
MGTLVVGALSLYPLAFADTTSTLRPAADGGNDSAGWKNTSGTQCNQAECYLEVDEGGSCDGNTSYIEGAASGENQTFDIDESGIPNNAVISSISITACYAQKKKGGGNSNSFQTRRCTDGACTNSGTAVDSIDDAYQETTQNHSGLSITKTASTDLEIGISITGTSGKETRISQISATITYTTPIIATASVDTSWVKGGSTGKNFAVTVNNDSSSASAIQWIKITRPSSNYTLTAGVASGWSAAVTAEAITFTGGSISAGGSAAFTVTADTAAVDEAQTAWSVSADNDSGGASPTNATASASGALNTGIDSTAPTSVSISSVNANSDTQLTANAGTASDSGAGIHATPYWFDETSGNSGATDSTSWQSGTSFVDTGLSASTQYCYRVKARDAVLNESAFSTEVCGTTNVAGDDTTAPSAVSNLSAGTPTGNSIRLTWTAPGDDGTSGTASSYDIRYSTSPITEANWGAATQVSGEGTPKLAGSSEAFTVGGLSINTTYHFALKTSDEVPNISGLSNIPSETTTSEGDTTPPAISSIAATNIEDKSAVIIWTTNEIADSQVEYGKSASYGSQTSLDGAFVTDHSVTLTGLSSATQYHYRVKSRDSAENLAISGDNVFLTTGTPDKTEPRDIIPPAISDVAVTTDENSAVIAWFTDEPTRSFVLYGPTTAYGSQTELNITLLTSHTVTVTGLTPETEYNFQIVDEDATSNRTFFENRVFTTKTALPPEPEKPPPPPAPIISEVATVAVRPSSAKIAWKTDVPATSQVRFGAESGNLTQLTIEFTTLSTEHSVTVSNLSPNTVYFFSAISRNAVGERVQSSEGSFQTESLEIQTVIQVARPLALPPGSPGTQVPRVVAGEMVTAVPILQTEGDSLPPEVVLFDFIENPTENTSPLVRGRASDRGGVIAGISYSTDNGVSWHPTDTVVGIGSSAAQFSARVPNLREGNHPILFRVRDNSNNRGTSETKVLIVDIRPPATGANAFFMGNQSIIPAAFGAISTLTNIAHKIVISAVGGATTVEVLAKKLGADVAATILSDETIAESELGIASDLAVGSRGEEVLKLQQLLVDEEVYPSELATGYFGERTKEGVARFQEKYSSFILTSAGLLHGTGIIDPPTKRKMNELLGVAEEDHISAPLSYSKPSDLWFGDVSFPEEGLYAVSVRATDGTGKTSERTLNPFSVAAPGIVIDAKTDSPVSGARVSVFQFSGDIHDFLLWPGDIFNQANPQTTGADGSYRFILPPGKYYITVEKNGYRTFFTDIVTLKSHQTVNFELPILRKPGIALPVSLFGIQRIGFPHLPDFFGMRRVSEITGESVLPPEEARTLLGKLAPVFQLPTPTGEIIDIRYLRGKKTILSVWATWSPLAQIQIPILDELQRERQSDTAVLLLSLQESAGTIETYLRRGGYVLQSVTDADGALTGLYPILTLPQHFFIDRRGVLQDIYVGFLNKAELEEKLEQL